MKGCAQMKYCPYCGNQLNDNMLFCNMCGKPYSEAGNTIGTRQYEQPYNQPASQPNKRHIFRTILIVLGAILGLIILVDIVSSVFNMQNYNHTEIDYDAEYKQGITYYDMRQYDKAIECFSNVDEEYKSTRLYNILCQGHIRHYLTEEQISELKQNLEFSDTKTLLLSDSAIAERFLIGYWTTEKKSKKLEFYIQGDDCYVQTDLATSSSWDNAEGFYIIDGVFGLYLPKKSTETNLEEKDSEYDRKDLFRISILDKDKIAVVILKDDSRYVMTRE